MRGRDLTPLDLSDPNDPPALWAEQRAVMLAVQSLGPTRPAAASRACKPPRRAGIQERRLKKA